MRSTATATSSPSTPAADTQVHQLSSAEAFGSELLLTSIVSEGEASYRAHRAVRALGARVSVMRFVASSENRDLS